MHLKQNASLMALNRWEKTINSLTHNIPLLNQDVLTYCYALRLSGYCAAYRHISQNRIIRSSILMPPVGETKEHPLN